MSSSVQWVLAIHPEGSSAPSSLEHVGSLPTALISSIRSCPGRLASVSPYVTYMRTEKDPLIRMIRSFLCFPFLNIVSELCVTNALSAFPPRGTTLTIFNILHNSNSLLASELSLFLCEGG